MRQRKQGECVSFIYESSLLITLKSRKVVFILQCQFFKNCGSYLKFLVYDCSTRLLYFRGFSFQKGSGGEMAVQSLTRF